MNKRALILLVISLSLLLMACSASQFGWEAESANGKSGRSAKAMNEEFDPLSLNDDDIEVPETPKQTNKVDETPGWIEDADADAVPAAGEVEGFRVQLMATQDMDAANEAKKSAILRFADQDVYLVFETPYYKLRVGNFATLKEAKAYARIADSRGFADAWPVPCRITLNRETSQE